MNKDEIGVALVKRLCPVCCEKHDGGIVMNTIISKYETARVEKLHQQVVGFLDKPCKNCEKEGFIHLVGIIPEKSDTSLANGSGVYRAGMGAAIRKEVFYEVFEGLADSLKNQINKNNWCFVDKKVIEHLEKISNENGSGTAGEEVG
jgi:hypothetical protein